MAPNVSVTPDAKRFLLTFTFQLFILPVATLLLVRDALGPALKLSSNFVDGLAIISAVVVVQLLLVWSCLQAFKPEADEVEHEKAT